MASREARGTHLAATIIKASTAVSKEGEQRHDLHTMIGRRPSSPEMNPMAGGIYVHKEGLSLRNYNQSHMSVHESSCGERQVQIIRRSASRRAGARQNLGWSPASFGDGRPQVPGLGALRGVPVRPSFPGGVCPDSDTLKIKTKTLHR